MTSVCVRTTSKRRKIMMTAYSDVLSALRAAGRRTNPLRKTRASVVAGLVLGALMVFSQHSPAYSATDSHDTERLRGRAGRILAQDGEPRQFGEDRPRRVESGFVHRSGGKSGSGRAVDPHGWDSSNSRKHSIHRHGDRWSIDRSADDNSVEEGPVEWASRRSEPDPCSDPGSER